VTSIVFNAWIRSRSVEVTAEEFSGDDPQKLTVVDNETEERIELTEPEAAQLRTEASWIHADCYDFD